jgi:hypothetical protein
MELEKTHKARPETVGKTYAKKPRQKTLSDSALRLCEIREIKNLLGDAAHQLTCCKKEASNELINSAYERLLPLVTRNSCG